jgi:hypothetical protein
MIITFLRSSSYGTHEICPHKYFLEYTLGIRSKTNEKASVGSAFHKAMECLARKKLALDRGDKIVDLEDLGKYPIDQVTYEFAARQGFETYKKLEQPQWTSDKYEEIYKLLLKALDYCGGKYNPLNQNIVDVELRFDFTLPHDWAHYRYELPNGEILDGQLGLKGTMDLLTDEGNGVLCLYDYKSGLHRSDINTRKDKEYEDFLEDFQINLYRYAVSKLYPEVKNILFNIWYLRAGGLYTLALDSDPAKIEGMIREKFEKIKSTKYPSMRREDWFCRFVCSHYGTKQPGTNQSICCFIREQVQKKGADRVTAEYGNAKSYMSYGSGGGRSTDKTGD